MFGLGSQELLVILVIVFILFGANRLPELARSLGTSVREFKKGVSSPTPEGSGGGEEPPPQNELAEGTSRACAQCKTSLAPDWTHCPRCEAAA